MQDFGGIAGSFTGGSFTGGSFAGGMERLLMAETLGLAMARRAAEILHRHRETLARDSQSSAEGDGFALDDAIFTAVLDATNECLGRFDSRPPADRWCDALLHLLDLARYAAEDGEASS
jgi:hypothetical protein